MKTSVVELPIGAGKQLGQLNRQKLHDANVFTLSIVGGPGCGKTALIDAIIDRLMPDTHVGIIAGDLRSHRDADRIAGHSQQVVQVTMGERTTLDAAHVRDALARLDLTWIDLLLIENVGSLTAPADRDLGQDSTAVIFSVAAGDDKADKHPDLVRSADVILINKTDLLPSVPFDLSAFRADVQRINSLAAVFEVSPLHDRGLTPWLDWLRARVVKEHDDDASSRYRSEASLYIG